MILVKFIYTEKDINMYARIHIQHTRTRLHKEKESG